MPYLAHFGLTDHPFTLTPNVDYYFPTQDYANIVASLDFALRRDSGIIKIVGEVGTGKTLLCRLLINKLVDSDKVAYINAPQADSRTIIRTVCEEFGVDPGQEEGMPYSALNRFLVETHAENKLAVVVVDEAQHLGRDGLEAVRLLSNLETETRKLLQIVLFGQAELDDLLKDPSLRQLAQRVVFSFNTKTLTVAEAKRYVVHRLKVSRREGVDYAIFSDGALDIIAKRSGGTPRVLNILADKSLLVAFAEGSPTVQRAHALEAVRDTPGLTAAAGWWRGLRFLWAAGAVVLVALMGAGGAYAWHVLRHPPATPIADVAAVTPVSAAPIPDAEAAAKPDLPIVLPVTEPVAPAAAPPSVVAQPVVQSVEPAAAAPAPEPVVAPVALPIDAAIMPEVPMTAMAQAAPVAVATPSKPARKSVVHHAEHKAKPRKIPAAPPPPTPDPIAAGAGPGP